MRFPYVAQIAGVQGRGRSSEAWDPALGLAGWRFPVPAYGATQEDLVAIARADPCQRWAIPLGLAQPLIDAVTQDLEVHRYRDFEGLVCSCYGVASTVGLMSMHIIGYLSDEAIPGAVMQGVAPQQTNSLRAIGEDYRTGRLCLARDELAEFGRSETSSSRPGLSESWRALMGFRFARGRRLYAEAHPGTRLLSPDGPFAIQAVTGLYRGIPDPIKRNDIDVFIRWAQFPAARRARLLTGLWLFARLGNRGRRDSERGAPQRMTRVRVV